MTGKATAAHAVPLSDDAMARVGKRPTLTIARHYTDALGDIPDPTAFFAAEKQTILDEIGDLSDVKVPLNRIVVAIWVRPSKRGSIIVPDSVRDEDKWQGVSGLVIKMGPHCFAQNDQIAFVEEDICAVGDWVMFRRGEGFRTRIYGRECVVLESEKGVKMVLPRPDMVY